LNPLRPDWAALARDPLPASTLWLRIALPCSLGVALALATGSALFNRDWHADWGYSTRLEDAPRVALTALLVSAGAPLLLAAIMQRVAAMYRARPGFAAALRVAVHGSLPLWLAGLTLFLMPMLLLGFPAALMALSHYGAGARALLGIAPGESAEFVGITMLLFAVLLSIGGAALSWSLP
jgi:hypothetical protein